MKNIFVSKGRYIGENQSCFIIAEAGINHNGSLDIAKKMIDKAIECGVDAIKFQIFKAEEFIADHTQMYTYYSEGKEVTEPMVDMFKRYEFKEEEWKEIVDYCDEKGIIFFATPLNKTDLDFILRITNMPLIKIGGGDLTNLDLIRFCASKNKPVIISAGIAYEEDIRNAINAVKSMNNQDVIVLHCVSCYPTDPNDVHLRKMQSIRNTFEVITGFSDHTEGWQTAALATGLGAKVIEKHFTLDNKMPGPDHWFSILPEQLKELVKGIRYAETVLGDSEIKPTDNEVKMKEIMRRSIVAKEFIKKGEKITLDKLAYKRPGTGISPVFVDDILNKEVIVDINVDELITYNKLK